jgi:hypothetical protein
MALIAVFLAVFKDWRKYLSPPTAKTRRPFVTLLLTVANRGRSRKSLGAAAVLCELRISALSILNRSPGVALNAKAHVELRA